MAATHNHSHTSTYRSVTFRIDEPVYQSLANASATTGMSMNSLVNSALAHYLVSVPQQPVYKPTYRSNYEETIKKLGGM